MKKKYFPDVVRPTGDKGSSLETTVKSSDSAQLIENRREEKDDVGGIDLTRKKINLETQGQGVEFNLPFDPNHLDQIPINGLTPVIFQITPITDLPLLLGLADEDSKQLSAVR